MNIIVKFVVCFIFVVQIQAASIDKDFDLDDWYNDPVTTFVANGSISKHIPYMVSIRHKARENDGFGVGHFCGGVLISRSHVLTLASCINRTTNEGGSIIWRPDELRLVVGSRYRYDPDSSLVFLASEIRMHPEYNWNELRNNVALIILQSPIGPDIRTIHPVSISDTTIPFGSKCDIMGWGTVFSGDGSRELRTSRVNVVHLNLCNNVPNRICAGPDYVRGCPGDDGGPFVCSNVVYGLIDFKNGNHCEKDIPGRYEYYINVADYYKWITEQMTISTLKDSGSGVGQILTNLLLLTSILSINFMFK